MRSLPTIESMDELDQAMARAAYRASWSNVMGWKRARGVFVCDLLILRSMAALEDGVREASARQRCRS